MATQQSPNRPRRRGLDIRAEMRSFLDEHPDGWNHDDWTGFVHRLSHAGYDTRDTDALGRDLEAERLRRTLESRAIPGLGPRRRDAIVDEFGTLWELRHADVERIAAVKGVPRGVAVKVRSALD